jgi:gluconokinase
MYVIGIDIGTGSTKAIAIEPSGKILVTSQVPYPILNSAPAVSEQDPELIWDAVMKCILRITTTLTMAPSAICLSSAMHSVIPVDHAGTPLMNMITWADNRSTDVAKRIRQSAIAKALYEQTGTPLHPMSPLSKITWLKEAMPDVFSSTYKFISIKEYVWHKLFQVYEIDYSIASATGLFSIRDLTWYEPALSIAGITSTHLSIPVNTTSTRRGIPLSLAKALSIPADTTFLIGASDGCMANLGSFATHPGIAALTIGTSGAIRVCGTSPVYDFNTMPFNYRLDEETFISGGPINNGGVALKWYAENLLNITLSTKDDYYNLLDTLDDTDAGCNGLLFLPYILGERAPIWNSESCGVFFGIVAQHKQHHFTRAVIEGVTMSLYQIARALERGGIDIRQINVSGGFVRSSAWVQILADIFGKKICLVNADDASATGAAFMGMKTLHIIDTYPVGDAALIKTYLPDVERHRKYQDEIFPRFEHLYRALVLEMAVLHDYKTTSLQTEHNTTQ